MTTQRDRILETFKRVLQQTTLRAVLHPAGRTPIELSKEEADHLLAPFEQMIEADFEMCVEIADQLRALGEQAPVEAQQLDEVATLELSTEEE